jgi:HK97 family phage major capsid protein
MEIVMTIQELREKRNATVQEMRALTATAEKESRDLTKKEVGRFDGLKTELVKIDGQLERAQVIADAERSMQTDEPRRGNDGSFGQMEQRFSLVRAIQAQTDPRSTDCGLELEVSAELARRSGRSPRGIMVPFAVAEQRDVLTSNTGGNLVPNPLRADQFIDVLRINPTVARAGAMTLDGLVGDVDIPRQITSGSTTTVTEHAAVSETSQTFDQVQLRPKTVGAYTEVSRRFLINSTPAGESVVRRDLAAAINVEIDRQALIGDPTTSPTTNEATGVVATSGINSVAFGGAPSWASIQSMIAAVAADNAEMGSLSFIGNSYTRKELLSTLMAASTDSRHLTEAPNSLAGYSLLMSNHLAGNPTSSPMVDGQLLYGNWSDLILGFWSGIDLLVNPFHTDVFDKGGALISAFIDFDVQVRHAVSFCKGTGITLTA